MNIKEKNKKIIMCSKGEQHFFYSYKAVSPEELGTDTATPEREKKLFKVRYGKFNYRTGQLLRILRGMMDIFNFFPLNGFYRM